MKTKKEATEKKIKVAKKLSTKNLPGMLKKKYNAKKFEKKISKKIYIPTDKEYVISLFTKDEATGFLTIAKDKEFSSKDVKKLKLICKQIKKQKGGFKFAPLIACVTLIAVIGVGVTLSKNFIVKKVLKSSLQAAFNAVCDVGSVNVEIFDSKLTINNLAVANKDSPMTNLFETEVINIDFSLTDLLKAKFVLEDLTCSDIKTNTERKTSGALPIKKEVVEVTKEEKKEDPNSFTNQLATKKDAALTSAKDGISDLFGDFDSDKLLEKCSEQLASPKVAEEVKKEAEALTEKWKSKPDEIETSLNSFKTNAEKLTKIDVDELKKNPVQLKDTITTITNTINDGKALSNNVKETATSIKTDVQKVKTLSTNLKDALTKDKNFAKTQINSIKSFVTSDKQQLLSGAIDSLGYQYLGKYYPYIQKAAQYAKQTKNSKKTDKEEKVAEKVETKGRLKGRFVYYQKDTTPKFLLKKALVSGENFSLDVKDVSSDMNVYGKPAVVTAELMHNKIKHNAKITADFRTDSKESAFTANYTGKQIPISFDFNSVADVSGMPTISGTGNVSLKATVDENAAFSISGDGSISNAILKAKAFEPEYASNIYNQALSELKSAKGSLKTSYSKDSSLTFNLDTDIDKQLMNAVSKLMSKQIATLKTEMTAKIDEQLKSLTGDANVSLNSFTDISSKINDQQALVDTLNTQLQSKLDELKSQATEKAKEAVTDKAKDLINSSGATDKLKGLFKR